MNLLDIGSRKHDNQVDSTWSRMVIKNDTCLGNITTIGMSHGYHLHIQHIINYHKIIQYKQEIPVRKP